MPLLDELFVEVRGLVIVVCAVVESEPLLDEPCIEVGGLAFVG